MRKVITSCAFGEKHWKMAGLSYPTFQRYARKIGADFVPIMHRKFPDRNPHLEKFQIRDLLETYDSVMWIDCDALVSKFACNIYEHVKPGEFAAVDEGAIKTLIKVPQELKVVADSAGLPYPEQRPFVYFNSGVFVCWKAHQDFFANVPERIPTNHGINDQTLLNVRVALSGTPFCALAPTWNMIWVPVGFEMAHIVHFAGRIKNNDVLQDMENLSKLSSFAEIKLGERM